MNINDDTKRSYQPPRLKVVSFAIEQGFAGSPVGSTDLFVPAGANDGTESYFGSSYGDDGAGFWDASGPVEGSAGESYNSFSWGWN